MRIIAFGGPKTSGKDTAANYLLARSSMLRPGLFIQLNYADAVRSVCQTVFGFSLTELTDQKLKEVSIDRWPHISPREAQISIAKLFRSVYSADVWVKAWERKMKSLSCGCIVITDLRHPEEIESLHEMGAKIIYIQNDRIEEERTRKFAEGDKLWSDVSESFTQLIKQSADAIITNNGTIPELHQQVHATVQRWFGDWGEWLALDDINATTRDAIIPRNDGVRL